MEVYSRDFVYPGREFRGFRARVDFSAGRVRAITDERGDPVPAPSSSRSGWGRSSARFEDPRSCARGLPRSSSTRFS